MDINPVNINDKKCEEMWARFVQYLKIKNRKITNIDLINYKNIIRKIINKEPVPPEYYRIAIEYLNCAHYDYLATKILFRNNIFSNSVYHLQQASEKMMKSLCLILGYTDPEKLKSTHITPQPLLALLQSKPSSDIQNICSNIANKNYRNELKKVVKIVNNNIIDQKKLREMPYKSTCRELGIETIIKIYDLIGDGNQALKVNVEQIYKELIEVFPEWKEQIHKDKSLIIGQLTGQCYLLGAITFTHESSSRYPSLTVNTINPSDYTSELGIVAALPELIERIPKLLENLSELEDSYRIIV